MSILAALLSIVISVFTVILVIIGSIIAMIMGIGVELFYLALLILFLVAMGYLLYAMCKYWKVTLSVLVGLWLLGMLYSAYLNYDWNPEEPPLPVTSMPSNGFF
jgi:hypothetical protein